MIELVLAASILLIFLPLYVFKRRKNVEIQAKVFCLWRTKHGVRWLDSLAKARGLRAIADMGMAFAFGFLGFLYLFLRGKTREDRIRAIAYYLFSASVSALLITIMVAPNLLGMDILVPNMMNNPLLLEATHSMMSVMYAIVLFGGLGFAIMSLLFLGSWNILLAYFSGMQPMPSVAPVLPGIEIPGSPIYVPIHALFALAILVFVHEMAHGILARREGIRVKSLGILTLGIIPVGAFTEPDETQLKKASHEKRTRVYSVGSMANIITGFIFFMLFMAYASTFATNFVYEPTSLSPSYIPWGPDYVDGLKVVAVRNNSPAYNASIMPGDVITNIDLLFESKAPNSVTTVKTEGMTTRIQRNSMGYMGFDYYLMKNEGNYDRGIWFNKIVMESLYWAFTLNFIIAVINFLPFAIFDGAHLMEDMFRVYLKRLRVKDPQKHARRVSWFFTLFVALLFLVGVLPYFI